VTHSIPTVALHALVAVRNEPSRSALWVKFGGPTEILAWDMLLPSETLVGGGWRRAATLGPIDRASELIAALERLEAQHRPSS